MRDISHRKAEEAELRQQARHDALTGLLNLRAFKEQVDGALRAGGQATVLFIDVDDLKVVNDTLGHAMGDALIQSFGLRIAAALPANASAARVGGDEFAVLIEGSGGLLAAHYVAASILEDPLTTDPAELADLTPACSIGIAIAPLNATTASELVARADLAMLAAKQQGGRRVRMFDAAMLNEIEARQRLNDELLLATKRDEWELHYQPQCKLEDGTLSGMEALLRWRHPERGLIMPAVFIEQLDEHLTSLDVGRWVVNEACRQPRSWRDQGLHVPRVSVNLFERQFRHPALADEIRATISQHGLSPGDLEIEITERVAIDPSDAAMEALRSLRDAGVHIAFDDFGTGYASLTTIKQLPLSRLKIDKSFVHDMHKDKGSAAIVDGIVSISKTMQIDVVAEGIENWQQVGRLRQAGCKHGQGYIFGKAMAPDLLLALLLSTQL
jgi:diguanylate cyclase (GGDEF)-like protein